MADTHSITGEESWFIDKFDLPVHDADDLRNYPGCDEEKYYTLEDIQKGDHALGDTRSDHGGMTETDADTSGKMDGPYTRINKKKGKWEKVRNKLSATNDMYNTTKPTGFGKLKF